MSAERAIELQAQSWALEADGKLDEASRACREALRLMEAAEGEASPDVANLLDDLAEIEQERQKTASTDTRKASPSTVARSLFSNRAMARTTMRLPPPATTSPRCWRRAAHSKKRQSSIAALWPSNKSCWVQKILM